MSTPTLSPTAGAAWSVDAANPAALHELRDYDPTPNPSPNVFLDSCNALAGHLLEPPNLKGVFESNAAEVLRLRVAQAG